MCAFIDEAKTHTICPKRDRYKGDLRSILRAAPRARRDNGNAGVKVHDMARTAPHA